MKDPYSVLGVSRYATDKEIKQAYRELAKKYHPDNFDDNDPLKASATEKMKEINEAYEEIERLRAANADSEDVGNVYIEIRQLINSRRFSAAEERLASVHEYDRGAEWHYLTCIILMHKKRVNDAMRELEIACTMDPGNIEYQKAKEMFNGRANAYGSTYYENTGRRVDSSSDEALRCCMNLICLDCLCECMGGDLIRCL